MRHHEADFGFVMLSGTRPVAIANGACGVGTSLSDD